MNGCKENHPPNCQGCGKADTPLIVMRAFVGDREINNGIVTCSECSGRIKSIIEVASQLARTTLAMYGTHVDQKLPLKIRILQVELSSEGDRRCTSPQILREMRKWNASRSFSV